MDERTVKRKRKLKVLKPRPEEGDTCCRIVEKTETPRKLSPEKRKQLIELQDRWVRTLCADGEDAPGEEGSSEKIISDVVDEPNGQGLEGRSPVPSEVEQTLEKALGIEIESFKERLHEHMDREIVRFERRTIEIAREIMESRRMKKTMGKAEQGKEDGSVVAKAGDDDMAI